MNIKPGIVAFLFCLAVLIPYSYSNWGLTESSEARYAEIGKEMYQSGDYLHPTLMGIGHYHKPPMTYYLTALGYSIAGINEYGARLFLQVAFLFQLLFVYLIAQLLFKEKTISLAAALIYFSFPIAQIAAKNLTTDAYLTTFIFASVYFFIHYREKEQRVSLLLFYLFSALAFLTKGPVGVLPQFIFAVAFIRLNKLKFRFGWIQITGLVLFISFSASWFLLLVKNDPDFLNYFVDYQLVKRVSGNTFNRSKPFWYYFLLMPAAGLPAFLYFFDLLFNFFSRKIIPAKKQLKSLLIPLGIMLLVFSLSSSKLLLYVLPLYLFVALLSAKYISGFPQGKLKLYSRITVIFGLFLFAVLVIGSLLQSIFILPIVPVFIVCSIGCLALLYVYLKQKNNYTYINLALLNALIFAFLVAALPFIMKANELKINSIKPIAEYIKSSPGKEQKNITVYDYLLPSLAFYTDLPITTFHQNNSAALRETYFTKSLTGNTFNYFSSADSNFKPAKIETILGSNQFLLENKKFILPDSVKQKQVYPNKKSFGDKWVLYYK